MRISDWSSDVCSSDLSGCGSSSGHCTEGEWHRAGEGSVFLSTKQPDPQPLMCSGCGGQRSPEIMLELIEQLFKLAVGEMFHADELIARLVDRADHFVKLGLHRRSVPIL